MRVHITVPEDLVQSVDALVGRRGRSEFFATAAREKIKKIRLAKAASRAAGSLAGIDIPGWETEADASAWVRASREADDARMGRCSET